MAVYLTSGAISKISSGKCAEDDLKPVLQVFCIDSLTLTPCIKGKQWYGVMLSDGCYFQLCLIANEVFVSKKLQQGSIFQLTNFQLTKFQLNTPFATRKGYDIGTKSVILCFDLLVIHSKCGIIGHPKLLIDNETPLGERVTPTIPDEDHANSHHVEEPPNSKVKQDHVDSLLNEDIDDNSHVEEPPTSIQNPSTSSQKWSSHSPTENKKRKLQSTDDLVSVFGKDIYDVMRMIVEKTIEDGLGPCYRKLGTLEEDVSKMKKMMEEKNKEDAVGACFEKLEILEEDVSKLTKMMTEKSKEDDMGACIEKLDEMGWGAEEPIYDTALLLFGQSADYRKLWLHLKPESCGKWVKNAGCMFGLMD